MRRARRPCIRLAQVYPVEPLFEHGLHEFRFARKKFGGGDDYQFHCVSSVLPGKCQSGPLPRPICRVRAASMAAVTYSFALPTAVSEGAPAEQGGDGRRECTARSVEVGGLDAVGRIGVHPSVVQDVGGPVCAEVAALYQEGAAVAFVEQPGRTAHFLLVSDGLSVSSDASGRLGVTTRQSGNRRLQAVSRASGWVSILPLVERGHGVEDHVPASVLFQYLRDGGDDGGRACHADFDGIRGEVFDDGPALASDRFGERYSTCATPRVFCTVMAVTAAAA